MSYKFAVYCLTENFLNTYLVGNYYSLRGDHDKAVIYFKQSLRLNPEYVAAWTLLGHEYIELKNTSAAIEAYRRATGKNILCKI